VIILDKLGISPEEAVMVGDRLDNDVYPAKRLGMRTIRVLSWPFSLQEARTPAEEPDATIRELKELPGTIKALEQILS
jgi:FMN phosphatase YigB (HAD superfamily)